MSKKWNLQDIRREEGEPRSAKRAAARMRSDMTPRQQPEPRPAPVEEVYENEEEEIEEVEAPAYRTEAPRKTPRKKSGSGMGIKIGVGVLGVIVISFLVSVAFGGAKVVVNPKHRDVPVQATFTAYANPEAGELGYEILSIEADGERQVAATGKENVSLRSEGTVTVYNAYSESTVRLVKNTRFESSGGQVFRATESIEIPGYTTDASGTVVPGSAMAEVFADAPGAEYNVGAGRFTLPGFEGEPEFDKIYAESKEAFTGGYEGEQYIIADAELKTAQDALHQELRGALIAKLQGERPAGAVLFEDSAAIVFESLPSTESGQGQATIKERGRIMVPIFKSDEFATYLAKKTILDYKGENVAVQDPYALKFSYASSTTSSMNLNEVPSVDFNLNGNAQIVWQFDEEKLKKDLAGLSKSAPPTLLAGYPAIESIKINIRPFWKRSLPKDPEDITLETVIGGD